ncbi:YraN family protein [Paenibacillus vini]|uniref:YraN family protein n=1 Tax=Paenibacillus vini TaxID=1476024 RepID=UPI0025B717A7|nr:YraN family protein [Paenibacillus vini]MDN4066824.1 YraN family protein [Paenibacillus vini]
MSERKAHNPHNPRNPHKANLSGAGNTGEFTKRPADRRKALGQRAEQLAADYLTGLGYIIQERNWRCRTGELDLIAWQGDILVIVEVRSRSSRTNGFGTPAESVTPRKIKQVRDTAAVYLHHNSKSNAPIRFDMIGIVLTPDGEAESLNHVIAAF